MDKIKILVVDDDEDILYMMSIALERYGYHVESAKNGFKALELLRSNGPFSVLLTDLMMPGMSGLELLREARRLDPYIEVITITAAATLQSAIAALRADGAYDYLIKPLESMSQLAVSVERTLAHRQLVLEREALQQKIKDEADRLSALVANTGDAILSADSVGVLNVVNPAAYRLLNLEKLEGTLATNSLPPQLVSIINSWQAVDTTKPITVETRWSDGSIQMVNLTPMKNEPGDSMGWVMVMRDITHVKRLDEMKTNMLIETARKIQVPLAQAMSDLTELNILAANDDRISKIVYRLTKVWNRIQGWGDELLALTQIDTAPEVQTAPVDLKTVLSQTAKDFEQENQAGRSLKLDLHVEPDLPLVNAEVQLLSQLVQGLVKRATLRSDMGSTISVNARKYQTQVWLEVKDNGPALHESELPHLFDRSVVKLKTGPLNTGLELATAKAITDQLNGQILVGGEPKGTVISVSLPVN
jgi:PAS domain S-box-containing protein